MSKSITTELSEYVIGGEKIFKTERSRISVKTFGVTSLLFDDGETKILFDAMVTRPNMLKAFIGKLDTDRDVVSGIVKNNQMENLSAVFVSHSHYDHVLDVPAFAEITEADVYGSKSTLNVMRGNKIEENRLHEFSDGGKYNIGSFEVNIIKSIHSPAKFYNNDLGKEILSPVEYPTTKRKLPEGGSYDFLVKHGDISFLIRPSCNYIEGKLKGVKADVMFFGVGQMSKMSDKMKENLYRETIEEVKPKLIVPLHWDNFFLPYKKSDYAFTFFDKPIDAMKELIEKLNRDGMKFEILVSAKR